MVKSGGLGGIWNVKCKHCCFVWIKVLKQDIRLLCMHRLDTRQVNCLKEKCQKINQGNGGCLDTAPGLTNAKYQQKYLELTTEKKDTGEVGVYPREKFKVTRQVEDNQDCPICFDELRKRDITTLGSQCPTCQNIVHTDCIQKWLTLGNSTCVFCRSSWEEFNGKKPNIQQRQSKVPKGAYLNLGGFRKYTYFGSDSEEEDDESDSS